MSYFCCDPRGVFAFVGYLLKKDVTAFIFESSDLASQNITHEGKTTGNVRVGCIVPDSYTVSGAKVL